MNVKGKKNSLLDGAIFFTVFILWIGALILYIRGYLLLSVISSSISLFFFIYLTNLRGIFMFKKKNPLLSGVSSQPLSSACDSDSNVTADVVGLQRRSTVIGRNASFNGDIEDSGDMDIYGSIVGNVNLSEGKIRIMSTGSVKGELKAPEIVIDGNVHGSCLAESIEILEHGTLRGLSCSQKLAIRTGGKFIGQSKEWQEPEAIVNKGQMAADEHENAAYLSDQPENTEALEESTWTQGKGKKTV